MPQYGHHLCWTYSQERTEWGSVRRAWGFRGRTSFKFKVFGFSLGLGQDGFFVQFVGFQKMSWQSVKNLGEKEANKCEFKTLPHESEVQG